ncbi:hypothetical protein Hydth_1789 [Hydrogenobacter thermophilus TK-6]|uniref:Uncharacterized protein n=1 Tax=Hydrogenobacter thermophilus (strain DSM 6534 / IAM 12695 / TK-6) TaxID=608538 RepID=D3DK99_HYDTT|nr:hypothetical protein Hydth_1789 [Hydrogenobacter thermophilus TK-6]BAI70251.1 hypothetical protein HTH_1807 [Hydrogenobacter thermophilus TK-6]
MSTTTDLLFAHKPAVPVEDIKGKARKGKKTKHVSQQVHKKILKGGLCHEKALCFGSFDTLSLSLCVR